MTSRPQDELTWLVFLARLPTEPARHRMAVWRELRKAGAVLVGSSAWAVPEVPATSSLAARVRDLVDRAEGSLTLLRATGADDGDRERLALRYHEARQEEWAEFDRDCDRYLDELAKEHRIQKYTLGELEEEEQTIDRLRRWYRELRRRDVLGTPGAGQAAEHLRVCQAAFDDYAEQVYTAVGSPTDDS